MSPIYLSPSQIEKYLQCPRRWGEIYLNGRREPSGDAAEAGTRVHALLEKHLRDGTPIPCEEVWNGYAIGEIAMDMCKHLPLPGTVPDVEISFELEVDGIRYRGRIDALHNDVVYDHKTTSNLRYAKKDLSNDIQATIYGRWLDRDGLLQWTTGQSKGDRKSIKTRLPVVKDEMAAKFNEIVTPVAREILAAYAHGDVKLLDKNTDSCTLYRPTGCPFLNKGCNGQKEKMTGKPTLMERMRLAQADEKKTEESVAIASGAVSSISPEAFKEDSNAFQGLARALDPINAPDVVRPEPTPEAPAEIPKKKRKTRELTQVAVASDTPMSAMLDSVAQALREKELDEQNRRNEAHLLQPTYPVSGKPIGTLYVDCLPLHHVTLVHAHTLIAKAHNEVCADAEVLHFKLVDFAKGGGMLAAQLKHDILKLTGPFDLALNARTPEGRDVLQTLCELSQNVVVGL